MQTKFSSGGGGKSWQLSKKNLLQAVVSLVLTSLVMACAREQPVVELATTAVPSTTEPDKVQPLFRVIAYVTASVIPELIPYECLTHINYSFLVPNDDGSFAPLANEWKLEKIVDEAHQAEVQVLISVGGWGWDEAFESLAADPALRAIFVENLTAFVDEHDLDGADIDWEYPDSGQSAENFLSLTQELRQAMPDKLLTTAVVSHGATGDGVASETFELFDFVNVMTYDGSNHGSMEQFNAGLRYWQGRGLPPEKTVMGVPFYARPSGMSYRKIVELDRQAAYADTIELNGAMNSYNGIPTVQDKTRLAKEQAGGIMFWTLEHDAVDELSLLKAIDEVVRQE